MYNQTHHLKGFLFNFLNDIKLLTNVTKSLEYIQAQFVSDTDADLINPGYVQRNLADLSISILPEYPDWLALSSFSMSFTSSTTISTNLRIIKKTRNIWAKDYTMTIPFDCNLCYALIVFVFVVALVNVYFSSPSRYLAYWDQKSTWW